MSPETAIASVITDALNTIAAAEDVMVSRLKELAELGFDVTVYENDRDSGGCPIYVWPHIDDEDEDRGDPITVAIVPEGKATKMIDADETGRINWS